MTGPIPVVLFAYARPAHLVRVLASLKENGVPLIEAFADGAKGAADAAAVAETRALLRAVDWCKVRLTERKENWGLGKNVLAGVTAVAAEHEAFVVWEDDLIAVPGTYAWMCAALRAYAGEARVMSVAAWTHPELVPLDASESPYFDERAESWLWGAYARSWRGMEESARSKIRAGRLRLSDYGADLPLMAANERRRRTWAIRWIAHHLALGALCVRPPRSLVEHLGDGADATNSAGDVSWRNPLQWSVPSIPVEWPAPKAASGGDLRWRRATWRRLRGRQRLMALFSRWL